MTRAVDEAGGERNGAVRTLNANLYDQMRADIVECRLDPGDRLRFDDLRKRYGATVGPLREALMRLSSDALVVLEEHKGFRVAGISRAQLDDIVATRRDIEPIAIRKSIALGDDRWEAEVIGAFHQLSKRSMQSEAGVLDEVWEERHRAFHRSLYAACSSPWLMYFCSLLYDQGERYRRLWFRKFRQTRDVGEEHRQLMEAVVRRDSEAASFYFQSHIKQTASAIRSILPDKRPGG